MEFESLKLIDPILNALEKKGYVEATPIQEKTIPLLLANKDVIGIAQTGTGKTAAFTVPILQKLHETKSNQTSKAPKALILVPTRELAVQIYDSFSIYGQFLNLKYLAVYGGISIRPQIDKLSRGIDILIATPGRLIDLMNQGRVDLYNIKFLVLDEADRMLDMGFLKDIRKIVSALPKERQSLFFSATMSDSIYNLTKDFLNNPVRIDITPQSTPVDRIEQAVYFIDKENKNELLLELIEEKKMKRILVFVAAKHKADRISRMLSASGINSDSIHGNKSQSQRMRALHNFKTGRIQALVATDIAARGIDVKDISHVINYDLPNEPENYIHRIGRTARAGNEGVAYSFCEAQDRNFLHEIERITNMKTNEADHKYHSLTAKNAVGVAAKPKPRGSGRRPSFGGGQRSRFGRRDRKPSYCNEDRDSKPNFRNRDRGSRPSYGRRLESSERRSEGSRPNSNRGRFGRKKPRQGQRSSSNPRWAKNR